MSSSSSGIAKTLADLGLGSVIVEMFSCMFVSYVLYFMYMLRVCGLHLLSLACTGLIPNVDLSRYMPMMPGTGKAIRSLSIHSCPTNADPTAHAFCGDGNL